jgi:hypothetical protein
MGVNNPIDIPLTTRGDVLTVNSIGQLIRIARTVTDGDVLLVDGAESAGIKFGTASGGGDWSLIERKEIAADTNIVDFTGLDGDTEGHYLCIARIKQPASYTGTAIYGWTFVGATSGSATHGWGTSNSVWVSTSDPLNLGNGSGAGSAYGMCVAIVGGKRGPDNNLPLMITQLGTGQARTGTSNHERVALTHLRVGTGATNLTGIRFRNNGASAYIGDGSALEVYAMG